MKKEKSMKCKPECCNNKKKIGYLARWYNSRFTLKLRSFSGNYEIYFTCEIQFIYEYND